MAGFLAAVTQAPLTAFVIVMEMVDGHALVLSLMTCAFLASGISRFISAPLYSSLAVLQMNRIPGVKQQKKRDHAGPKDY
jgi:H+/Cl- antiporter ClcA